MKILAIVGSLRAGSYNKKLLANVIAMMPEGVEIESFDLSEIPLFNQDSEGRAPDEVMDLKKHIVKSDAILIITPEYNYSVPGVLKNAIDWSSRPYGDNSWEGKRVILMSASVGNFGGIRAQMSLRQSFVFLGVKTINRPEFFLAQADRKFDQNGRLIDAESKEKLKEFTDFFLSWLKEDL